MLHPRCPECETNLWVVRNKGSKEYSFKCYCGAVFNPSWDSKWYRLDEICKPLRRDFVGVEIRGLRPEAQARIRGVKTETVKDNVIEAKRRIGRIDGDGQSKWSARTHEAGGMADD